MNRPRLALTAASAVLLLAACAPTAPADPGAPEPGADPGATGACPVLEGYELFSSDFITAAPAEGFAYTESTPIEFTLSLGAGYTPSMGLSYVNEAGDAIVMGEQNLLDNGDGSYYNDLGVFDSDAAGRPGFATIRLVADGSFEPPAGQESFDIATLGVYCVSF
jgi:hypothetical protein